MILDTLSAISILFPVIAGVLVLQRLSSPAKILFAYVVFTASLEAVSLVYYVKGWNNLFLFHLHTYVQFALFSWIFARLLDTARIKNLIYFIAIIFISVSLFFTALYEDTSEFNTLQRHAQTIIMLLYSGLFMFTKAPVIMDKPEYHPFRIFTIGIVIYFIGTLFLFSYAQNILTPKFDYLWVFHDLLNIIVNVAFGIVFIRSSMRNTLPKMAE